MKNALLPLTVVLCSVLNQEGFQDAAADGQLGVVDDQEHVMQVPTCEQMSKNRVLGRHRGSESY